jgi:hypothetical protein
MLAVGAVVALMACDKGGSAGGSGEKCEQDGDCKNGFLCEAKTCVPQSVAQAARDARSGAKDKPASAPVPLTTGDAPTTASAEVAKVECGPPNEVPSVPSDKTDPPQGTEWTNGCDVNTQGANAQPPNCTMKILREWLQVTCKGDVLGYEEMEHFGNEGSDYFKQIVPGSMASFVLRLKKGTNQKVRICRTDGRASLFVSWPGTAEKPLNLALGVGPKCDGSQWGTTH